MRSIFSAGAAGLAFSPDDLIATAPDQPRLLRIYDLNTGNAPGGACRVKPVAPLAARTDQVDSLLAELSRRELVPAFG